MATTKIPAEFLADNTIVALSIAENIISTRELAANGITSAQIASNAILTRHIDDNQITGDQIADNAVGTDQLAGIARGKIIVGDASGNPALLSLGSNGYVLKSDGSDIGWAEDATVAALTTEQVQDIAGAMFSSNTETGIAATYQDGDGTIDLVVGANVIVAGMIAQNSITVTQLADDCVESDKIADGIITTNHLNKAMISSQTEVTAVAGDFVLLGDTSDSNNLKKTPVSAIAGLSTVGTGDITTAKIADDAVTSDKLAANPTLTGSEGVVLPSGTTAERPGSPADGVFRFNTTTDLMEYYNGTNWQGLYEDQPIVTSISPTTALNANQAITITGKNFRTGAVVQFVGNDGTKYNSPSTTFNSHTQLTATTPSSALTVANEPYDIKVLSASGLSGTLDNALDAGSTPAFGVASGTLGTIVEGGNASGFTQITATDADSQSLTISLKSGSSLPSGVSLSSSGVFSGTLPTTGSAVTTSFTVQVTDGTNTAERNYTITSRVQLYAQLSGSGTWSVPSGVDVAEILIVAGGGSGGKSQNVQGTGGGAGGVVHRSSYTFTSTDKSSGVVYSVGAGGNGLGVSPLNHDGGGINGADTTFALSGGTITSKGGGYGGGYGGNAPFYTGFSQSAFTASAGGSGGGGGADSGMNAGASNQGNFSGWTSYGNAGGTFNSSNGTGVYPGSGGGGAGGAGGNAIGYSAAGVGGVGKLFSTFTSYGESGYFGGGGAGGTSGGSQTAGGNGGGGDGGNGASGIYVYNGGNAVDGTGGGGGGCTASGSYGNGNYKSGDGGNGTILIAY